MPNLEEAEKLRNREWISSGGQYSNLNWWYWVGYTAHLRGYSSETTPATEVPLHMRDKARDMYAMGYADAKGDHKNA